MQCFPRSVKHVGTTWGISGDVCVNISVVFFYRYVTTFEYAILFRANHGDECELPLTTCTPSIFGLPFLLVRMDRTACRHGIIHHIVSRNEP
jgi:hypothetical protein